MKLITSLQKKILRYVTIRLKQKTGRLTRANIENKIQNLNLKFHTSGAGATISWYVCNIFNIDFSDLSLVTSFSFANHELDRHYKSQEKTTLALTPERIKNWIGNS